MARNGKVINMSRARQQFENETKGMSLEEKLEWINVIIFNYEIDDYIQDKELWRGYLAIRRELELEREG